VTTDIQKNDRTSRWFPPGNWLTWPVGSSCSDSDKKYDEKKMERNEMAGVHENRIRSPVSSQLLEPQQGGDQVEGGIARSNKPARKMIEHHPGKKDVVKY